MTKGTHFTHETNSRPHSFARLLAYSLNQYSSKLLQRVAPGDYLQRKVHSQEILELLQSVTVDEKDQIHYELFKSMVRAN